MRFYLIISTKEAMFSLLFDSMIMPKLPGQFNETWWRGVAWAREEPNTFWAGSGSREPFHVTFELRTVLFQIQTERSCVFDTF